MTSAAHDESYGNPRWQHRPRGPWGGPWGFWGGCAGWQQARWSGRDGEGPWSAQSWGPAWGANGYGYVTYGYLVKYLEVAILLEINFRE